MSYELDKIDREIQEKISEDLCILHKAKAILTSRINVYDDNCVFRDAITSDRISKCIESLEDELI